MILANPKSDIFMIPWLTVICTLLGDENVLGFDITMENTLLIQILASLSKLDEEINCLVFFEDSFNFKMTLKVPKCIPICTP